MLFFLIYLFVDLFHSFVVVARTAGFVCLFVVVWGEGGVGGGAVGIYFAP